MNSEYKYGDTIYVSELCKNFGFMPKEIYGTGFGRIVTVLENNEYIIRFEDGVVAVPEYIIKFDNGVAAVPKKFILFKSCR